MDSYAEYVRLMNKVNDRPPDHLPVFYVAMLGRPIVHISMDAGGEDPLRVHFEGGGQLSIWDDAQSCCEHRYMTTDDDLPSFIGAKVLSIEEVPGPELTDEYGDHHEQMFVKLETTKGTITLVTHNEHNGYYGGFDVRSSWGETHG